MSYARERFEVKQQELRNIFNLMNFAVTCLLGLPSIPNLKKNFVCFFTRHIILITGLETIKIHQNTTLLHVKVKQRFRKPTVDNTGFSPHLLEASICPCYLFRVQNSLNRLSV